MTSQPTLSNWLSVSALGLIWGGTFMVVAIALQGYGPLTVACARTTLGAVSLLTVLKILGRPWPAGRTVWTYLAVIGPLNTALPFFLLSWGQQHVPSAFAGLAMTAVPLFVLPLAHLVSDEKLALRKTLGVLLGFIGAAVLLGPGALRLGQGVVPLAQLACLGAALSYAVASVLTRRCPPVDSIAMAAITLAVGAVCLIPAMLLVEGLPVWQPGAPGLAILFLGLVPTALAALLRVTVVRSAGSVFMTLVNYQVPVWSMVFGALVLNEALPGRFFLALVLIVAGLAISQWRNQWRAFVPRG
ncbi:MAG: DMT family transporter [Salibaculum sp.]|jgi:drug/metabolite transporter (DMT)-like permease|uniref:DMT family transporter n=1 Tax=Roseovarius halophilus (ex Wu et al. 2025) TaxID=3376060 RepID=UPI00286FE025|nr:DMT family transporter [Salibaculum sp.]MDR9426543.1 DMT family transporter [Salibaculum sp.]MDR9481204.1 DMT family transporter [Salibaculum sp.]